MTDESMIVSAHYVRNAMDAHADMRAAALDVLEALMGPNDEGLDAVRRLARGCRSPYAVTVLGDYLACRELWRKSAALARLPS